VNATERERFHAGWQDFLVNWLGANPAPAEEVFRDLAGRHGEPTRHYHTLGHIRAVLTTVHELNREMGRDSSAALILAAWFHDVIYDAHASDNEERSAEYARCAIEQMGLSSEIREETARLILLTTTHETKPADRDGQVLLDADLAILGADEAAYDAYAAAIRREYDWVSEPDYRAGRRKVLERFLARPRLYFTEPMFERAEARARANLAREIAALA
jgi:predicted metal-dependent HD superfamily phosphohydrolase